MKYNKIFQFAKGGIHKRNVIVTNNLMVETMMIPKDGLPLLARELSSIVEDVGHYRRICPYRYTIKGRHIYIEFAEPRKHGYEIIEKKIIQFSHKGNFKIPEGTFLFDVLDYFVEIGLLDNDYKFIGKIDYNNVIVVTGLYDEKELLELGFKFPA